MNSTEPMNKYAEETGGLFHFDDIAAIPYNHWKKDCEWIVFIMDIDDVGAFITVTALTAREACIQALEKYNNLPPEDFE